MRLPLMGALLAMVPLLAACSDPRLNANLSLGPNGVSVTPYVSGRVGDFGVAVSP